MEKIIQRGAEAVIFLRGSELVKERLKKGYRIPQIDGKIRKQRTRSEAKLMEKARFAGVAVPKTRIENDFSLVMDYIKGEKLKDALNSMDAEKRRRICRSVGEMIAKLHSSGVIHGDLTTSNMILKTEGKEEVYLIDFGLGKMSSSAEDQAVDLFLLYEALKSTHFAILEECWESVMKSYAGSYGKAEEVISRMEKIKKRRRYK